MEKNSKIDKKMMLIGMTFLLIVLSPFTTEILAQPKPEGTLNVAVAELAEEGFFGDLGDLEQAWAWVNVGEFPFYVDPRNGNPIPALATGYEYSKDNLTLTLHVRKGVPWQDKEKWGEVTAEDVKYTMERAMQPGSTSNIKDALVATVQSMEVPDPYTFVMHLKAPAPEVWRTFFAIATPAAPILCKKYIETVGEDKARWEPIGSGPYRLVERKAGQYLKFEAVEKHWRVVPEYKYLVLHIVPEESTRMAMIKTGKIDCARFSLLQLSTLQNTPGIKTDYRIGGYSLNYCFGGMITPKDSRYKEGYHGKDPWHINMPNSIKVREALSIAIDRQAIIKAIYKGNAKAATVCFPTPGWDKLPPIPYDPDRAKKLLAEAGYPDGFRVQVASYSGGSAVETRDVTEIIAGYLTKIGLKVEIRHYDTEALDNLNRTAKTAGMIFANAETYKVSYTGRFYDKFWAESNPTIFMSDEHAALVEKYESETDPQKRAAALAAVRDYHYKNWVAMPLTVAETLWGYREAAIGDWAKSIVSRLPYFEYVRHPKPLNTWRLFTPGE